MSKGLYVALSGAIAQENTLDATATNIANVGSAGYQRLRPVFRQVLAKANPNLHYASMERTALDQEQGAIKTTNRDLDMVMPPGTFLAMQTTRGERYTRAGSLQIKPDGQLTTMNGTPLGVQTNPKGGPVTLNANGSVTQDKTVIGKLKLVKVERPEAMMPEGAGQLNAQDAGAVTPSEADITVGALEESNAQPVTEMTSLMTASRTFDAFQKILDTLGEADRKLLTTVPQAGDG